MADDPWFLDGRLHFGLGIENTFVPQERPGERAIDEYELTEHYERWYDDLGLAAEVGSDFMRWGIPWHRVNPAPGVWDWAWTDQVMARFAELGIRPIVDLLHYGTPTWIEDEFLHPRYPEFVAEYAARAAERYRGIASNWTPVNEPMIHALFSGEYAYWPPYASGADGLVRISLALARGFVLSQQAIARIDPAAVFVHVDASLRYRGDLDAPEHRETASRFTEQAFLVQDLVTGRVDDSHPLAGLLLEHGATRDDLRWFVENAVQPDVMGVNYYPRHSTEIFEAGVVHAGGFADPRPTRDDGAEGLAEMLRLYADRYGAPVMVSETCVTDTVDARIAWLDESVAAVERLRAEGLDVVGYTWWPLFDMIEWTYRHSQQPAMAHRLAMGLFELVENDEGLHRVRTPIADRFFEKSRESRTRNMAAQDSLTIGAAAPAHHHLKEAP